MSVTQYARRMEPQNLGALDKRVILSGAGLSRNWGGYLVAEMWGAILSNPQVQEERSLRSLLLREMNFETALAEVQNSAHFNERERSALSAATHNAFLIQDENQCHELYSNRFESWTRCSGALIGSLIGQNNRREDLTSFYFTVNQDILFERGFTRPIKDPPNMPGVSSPAGFWTLSPDIRREFLPYNSVAHRVSVVSDLPTSFDLARRLNYIKLHGSFNWYDEKGTMMVLGGGKRDSLNRFPLLQVYFEIFRDVLLQDRVTLLVVGYSFNDAHINEVIAEAARKKDLRLVVIDPRPPGELRTQLLLSRNGEIWDAILDYITRPPTEIFASDPVYALSGEVGRIRRSFLDRIS